MDLPMISEEPKATGQTSDFKKKLEQSFFLREFPAITLLFYCLGLLFFHA